MGTDVTYYVRCAEGTKPPALADKGPDWGTGRVGEASKRTPATHYISTGDRYWDERGEARDASRWPCIRVDLLTLMAACEAVWYCRDDMEPESAEEWQNARMTPELMARIDDHYAWALLENDRHRVARERATGQQP